MEAELIGRGLRCLSSVSSSSSPGFKHKELRGKLAIGITANFINRKTAAEAQVAEISGVARIYNQKFFQQLLSEKGVWTSSSSVQSYLTLCFYVFFKKVVHLIQVPLTQA